MAKAPCVTLVSLTDEELWHQTSTMLGLPACTDTEAPRLYKVVVSTWKLAFIVCVSGRAKPQS